MKMLWLQSLAVLSLLTVVHSDNSDTLLSSDHLGGGTVLEENGEEDWENEKRRKRKPPAEGDIYDTALDRNDTLHFFWRVVWKHDGPEAPSHGPPEPSYEAQGIIGEVHSRRPGKASWIGIGFSDRGNLTGADLCVYWIDWKGGIHFQNALVDKRARMVRGNKEVCSNFRHKYRDGVLKFTFFRKAETCSPGNYKIERGTTHLVWSWGSGPLYQLAGVLAEGDETGSLMVEILKPKIENPVMSRNYHRIKVLNDRVAVPNEETTYWCTVFKLPEEFRKKHHIVQYGPWIERENEDIVHHMELFHCEHPPDVEVPLYKGSCSDPDRPQAVDACKRVISAWAMGARPFSYPNEAGLPLGGPDFNLFVMLEVHYNNPHLYSGRVDSSGMEVTFTKHLREYDASIMELGLEYTNKMAIPPRESSFVLSGYCVPQCTALGIPSEGINIFGSQLHTHLTGARAWTKHFRDGKELPELNRDNHYSTHFQEIRRLIKPVRVLPGDSLVMSCEYNTEERTNATIGGFSIRDEMCVNYVHYYPKTDLEVCKSSIDTEALQLYFDFMNKYELQETSPTKGDRDNYNSIQWTPWRAMHLDTVFKESPLSMQCNRSSGERFPGYWDNVPIPQVIEYLPPPLDECKTTEEEESGLKFWSKKLT